MENTIQGAVALAKENPSEMERLYSVLNFQADIITTLGNRLGSVTSPVPTEPGQNQPTQPDGHITTAIERAVGNNRGLQYLIDTLVI